MTTIAELEDEVRDEVFGSGYELVNDNYHEDRLTEIADQNIPIYHSDLIEALQDDCSLSAPDECLYSEDCDVFKIISWAIYERLSSQAFSAMSKVKEAWEHWTHGDLEERVEICQATSASIFEARRDEPSETTFNDYLNTLK